MTRDPDDGPHPDGPGDGPRPEAPRPATGSSEFDAIVADWTTEGSVPRWPDGDRDPDPLPVAPAPARPGAAPSPVPDDDHFVPPEPPPLPRIGPPAAVGLVLLTLGLVLVLAPGLVGVPGTYGLPLGLVVLAAGLGWLVLRLWPDPPRNGDGDGEDDGAVL